MRNGKSAVICLRYALAGVGEGYGSKGVLNMTLFANRKNLVDTFTL